MKPTFSPGSKNFFDLITSYASIASVGLLILGLAFGEDIFQSFFRNNKVLAVLIAAIFILVPFFISRAYGWISFYALKKRKLGGIIIEQQDITIDIADGGAMAGFYEKLTFYKIGRRLNNHFVSNIEVSGTIEEIHTTNCFYKLNPERNKASISYVNSSAQRNKYVYLVKKADKFWALSATLKNTFLQSEESWDLIPGYYCINYKLQIVLPADKRVIYAHIYRINTDDTESEIRLNDITPVLTMEHGRHKIILHISNYDYGERFRLKWKTT